MSQNPPSPSPLFKRIKRGQPKASGYRLATMAELEFHLKEIHENDGKRPFQVNDLASAIMKSHDHMRLEDGWIDNWNASWDDEHFKPISLSVRCRHGFKRHIPHMLLIACEPGDSNVDATSDQLQTKKQAKAALLFSCEDGDVEEVKRIVESQANDDNFVLESDCGGGVTALHVVACEGHQGVWKLLTEKCENGLGPQTFDKFASIIHCAAECNNDGLFAIVLAWFKTKKVRNLETKNEVGETALHVAARSGSVEKVKALLDEKFDVTSVDKLGETPLLEAARGGHSEVLKLMLAVCPTTELLRLDSDGRTILHWAAQLEDENKADEMVDMLLEKCEHEDDKVLLASIRPIGVGTAGDCAKPESALSKKLTALISRKSNPNETPFQLSMRRGYEELAVELANWTPDWMSELWDWRWRESLVREISYDCWWRVNQLLHRTREVPARPSDRPARADCLGRRSLVEGIAALLLNPHTGTPVTIGLCGAWGMGKSSVMLQVEDLVLRTAASQTLQNPFTKSSKKGRQLLRQLCADTSDPYIFGRNWFARWVARVHKVIDMIKYHYFDVNDEETVDRKIKRVSYPQPLKGLAITDRIQLIDPNKREKEGISLLRSIPAVLTVHYNAWLYQNVTEAWAGLAVSVIEEMEATMTVAQRWDAYWRYSWMKEKQVIYMQLLLPIVVALILSSAISWVAWKLFPLAPNASIRSIKFLALPASVIVPIWTITNRIYTIIKPVSEKIHVPDHRGKLGYQDSVIKDICFVRDSMSSRPHWVWRILSYCCKLLFMSWRGFWFVLLCTWTLLCSCWAFDYDEYGGEVIGHMPRPVFFSYDVIPESVIPKQPSPQDESRLRIIVFVDDLDRCNPDVVLDVLRAINLVLAECNINVVLGIDKNMVEEAIKGKLNPTDGDTAEKFLRKIVQLPLELPDPTQRDFEEFLHNHLPKFEPKEKKKSAPTKDDEVVVAIPPHELQGNTQGDHGSSNPSPEIDDTSKKGHVQEDVNANASQKNGNTMIDRGSSNQLDDVSKEIEEDTSKPSGILSRMIRCMPGGGRNSLEKQENNAKVAKERKEFINPLHVRDITSTYREQDTEVLFSLQSLITDVEYRYPREWKRFLTYHRLAWNVLSTNDGVRKLPGWQVQLIVWVFLCWHWREQMDTIFKLWDNLVLSWSSNDPQNHYEDSTLQDENQKPKEIGRPSLKEIIYRYDKDNEPSKEKWRNIEKVFVHYDVSMEAIQLYQPFRFHCKSVYLAPP